MTTDTDLIAAYAAYGFKLGDKPPRRDLGEGRIDLTPTYTDVLPILMAALTNGTPEGRDMARLELIRMARIADLCNLITTKPNIATVMAKLSAEDQFTIAEDALTGGAGFADE